MAVSVSNMVSWAIFPIQSCLPLLLRRTPLKLNASPRRLRKTSSKSSLSNLTKRTTFNGNNRWKEFCAAQKWCVTLSRRRFLRFSSMTLLVSSELRIRRTPNGKSKIRCSVRGFFPRSRLLYYREVSPQIPPVFLNDAAREFGTENPAYTEWEEQGSLLCTWILSTISSSLFASGMGRSSCWTKISFKCFKDYKHILINHLVITNDFCENYFIKDCSQDRSCTVSKLISKTRKRTRLNF